MSRRLAMIVALNVVAVMAANVELARSAVAMNPPVGDAVENQNIAWNLALKGRFFYDWDDTAWRQDYASRPGISTGIERRSGVRPTASRPPVVPLIGSMLLLLFGTSPAVWVTFELMCLAFSSSLGTVTASRLGGSGPAFSCYRSWCCRDLHWNSGPG